MAGSSPRRPGLAEVQLERQLCWVADGDGFWFKEPVERLSVDQIGSHEAGELQRAGSGLLGRLCQRQEQKGDPGDGDLDLDGVYAGAEKVADWEGLLDPAEELRWTPIVRQPEPSSKV